MAIQQTDPYTAPQSDVGDMEQGEFGEVKIFSFSGRIGRIRYLAYSMGLMLAVWLLVALIVAMVAPAAESGGDAFTGMVTGVVMVVAYALMLVASFTLAVRRLNDFDSSGWLSLLLLVPVVNAIFGIALWVVPGTKGANRYGPPPPPNSGGATFLALLLPIIAIIGILAAIAIPQYQQYVERAAEIQSQ